MPASRSLIALLAATLVFFGLWIVALKPGSSSKSGAPSQGLGGYQADINKAHQAVQISAAANARAGGDAAAASTPAAAAAPAGATTTSSSATTVTRSTVTNATGSKTTTQTTVTQANRTAGAANRFSTVQSALKAHKVVALLFFNPAAADDRAVKQELEAIPTHRGRVVKLTIPLSEVANYTAVTQQVPVNLSPTLVLIAGNGQAGEIVGFSDQFEIAQRVDDALAAR